MSDQSNKISITVKVNKPKNMPLMLNEEVGKGAKGDKSIVVNRSASGKLLMVHTTTGPVGEEKTNNYIIDVGDIVEGILTHEENVEADDAKTDA